MAVKLRRLTLAVLCLAAVLTQTFGHAPPAAAAATNLCGKNDLPETGLQGEIPRRDQQSRRAEKGYNCGLSVVGHATLNAQGRAPDSNANMAWSQHCAYVAGPGSVPPGLRGKPQHWQGVAVIDVADPTNPRHVRTLTGGRETELVAETITALDAGNRHILVVGEYGNVTGGNKPSNIYDVTDCTKPKLLQHFIWPFNIHNFTISGNGRYLFATQPLQVVDLDPLFAGKGAKFVGNLDPSLPSPIVGIPQINKTGLVPTIPRSLYSSHEAWPSFDGTRLYIGGQTPNWQTFTIVDIKEWLKNPAVNKPRVISQSSGRGHSVRPATINGHKYLLHSEEGVFGAAYSCLPSDLGPFAGPAEAYLSNIDDEAHPKMQVSKLGLEINKPKNCPTQLADTVNNSVHYHDVNDPNDTRFAMLSMWNSGLRIMDVRDPLHPKEVAYFNPGDVDRSKGLRLDVMWAHVRYDAERGQIWVPSQRGGFWVLQLEPQLLDYFGLRAPKAASLPAGGRPGTVGWNVVLQQRFNADTTVAGTYCTIGSPVAALLPSKP